MPRVIFDIETAGGDFDALHDSFKAYFLRFAESEDEIAAARESLSFYPLTAQIVAIGMLNPDTGRGAVYYQAPKEEPLLPFEEEGIRYESGTEKDILERFWRAIKSYTEFITFNGRCFDCPFILVRSAMHRIKPTRDIMPNRYAGPHIDLMDQLTFYGATKRFSLDLWCRALGIKSPKEETKGHEVRELFAEGRYLDIARYCIGDLRATKELFDLWQNYMKFTPERPEPKATGAQPAVKDGGGKE